MSSSFDAVMAQLEASQSNTNFYRNLTPQDRATLNNTSLADNITDSANDLIRSLDPQQFQRLDYGRDTQYDIAQRQDCMELCQRQMSGSHYDPETIYHMCKSHCSQDTRRDFV